MEEVAGGEVCVGGVGNAVPTSGDGADAKGGCGRAEVEWVVAGVAE